MEYAKIKNPPIYQKLLLPVEQVTGRVMGGSKREFF